MEKKGLIDIWFWLGLMVVLLVFALLLSAQQSNQRIIEPSLVPAISIFMKRRGER